MPDRGDCLSPGIKLDTLLAIHVEVTPEGLFVAREREEWKRYRDRDVDSKLTGLTLVLKDTGIVSTRGEDGTTVTILIP